MDRKSTVRLQFQRIIGGIFIIVSLVLLGISWGNGDASGAILVAVFGLWMLLSKEYIFWDGESKSEN